MHRLRVKVDVTYEIETAKENKMEVVVEEKHTEVRNEITLGSTKSAIPSGN